MADMATPRAREQMPRAASYTYLRNVGANSSTVISFEGTQEADAPLEEDTADSSTAGSSGFTTPEEYPELAVPAAPAEMLVEELKKVPSARTRRSNDHTYGTKAGFDVPFRRPDESIEAERTVPTADDSLSDCNRGSIINKSTLRRLGRHSWYGLTSSDSSRSPSPSKVDQFIMSAPPIPDSIPTPPPKGHVRKKSLVRRRDTVKVTRVKPQTDSRTSADAEDSKLSMVRRSTLLKKRPNGGMFRGSNNDVKDEQQHSITITPPLPHSFSAEKLPIIWSSVVPMDRPPPSPLLAPPERSRSQSRANTRKKDELWPVFRSLEADFVKFSTKTSAFKTNVIRDSLIPFLRTYANHATNDNLRPEDLERRANILNMWWIGLLDMLHGRNSLSVSGTDRPAVLDGVMGIMERPEWRQSPSQFSPLSKRSSNTPTPTHSTISFTSSASDFVAESVHHHVKNMFIQNLTTQMAFVVDKMSLRNASASLVIFCGKACAYAFAFVPGVADILVRLWRTPKETIARVLDEQGIGKFDSIPESVSGPILFNYPPALHQLGFMSLAKCVRKLRAPPQLPPTLAGIPWWSRWIDRWIGHESDLFYVFVKYFHVLASDFLPPDSSRAEVLCIPGLVLVHAQILVNLDATVHRDSNQLAQQEATSATSSQTFDDLLADPDAVATPLPILPNNAVRFMAENRLIMLIRDFLSERTAAYPQARQMFAKSINALLQATTKRTSMFDQGACFTLLDFLEEALVLLSRYEQLKELDGRLIDSGFWLDVYKRMIGSENTMIETRLYAYLYTVWNTIAPDWGRRMSICLELLLDREVFQSRFNHWCPMVRAYYMRLLCWRVLRYDGEEHDGDLQILETARDRLRENWSQYSDLRRRAEERQEQLPNTSPCNAAPGRRLLIMKIDTHMAPDAPFMSMDGTINRSNRSDQPPPKRGIIKRKTDEDIDNMDNNDDPDASAKGLGGFLRKMVWNPSNSRSKSPIPTNPEKRNSVGSLTSTSDNPPRSSTSSTPEKQPRQPAHRHFSFRFSLEMQNHHHHPHHQHYPYPKRISGNPSMRLQPPRLPAPAQAFVQTRSRDTMGDAVTMTAHKDGSVASLDGSSSTARYCGRALAEWTIVIGECHNFFDRRRNEGVPCDRMVETPGLSVETLRRPN